MTSLAPRQGAAQGVGVLLRVATMVLGIAAATLIGSGIASADAGSGEGGATEAGTSQAGSAPESTGGDVSTPDPGRTEQQQQSSSASVTGTGSADPEPAVTRPKVRFSALQITSRAQVRKNNRTPRDPAQAHQSAGREGTAKPVDDAEEPAADGAANGPAAAPPEAIAVVSADSARPAPVASVDRPEAAAVVLPVAVAPAIRRTGPVAVVLPVAAAEESAIRRIEPVAVEFAAARIEPPPAKPAPSPLNVVGSVMFNALAAAVRVFDPPPVIPPGSPVTRGTSTLDVSCGCGQALEADWYFPAEEPVGVIYVQHGFFRSKNNMSSLAVQLSEQTNSIVVVPTVSSNPFASDGCWINGDPMHLAVASLFTGERTALTDSASAAAGRQVTLPRQYVLAGHSAGGNLAAAAAGYTTTTDAIVDLRAVVMFDGVDNGGAIAAAAGKLSGPYDRPIYQIAGDCSLCNAFGSGTTALEDARPDSFVGVRLKGGTHVDAEGASAGLLAWLACGFPRSRNVNAVPIIAAGWIDDVFTGSHTGIYGEPGERIHVDGATAVVLGAETVLTAALAA